jgi:adenylate cyclase
MAADEGHRKLTAILAADVAGYSRLMADDDRATIRTLTEYRDVFAKYIESHEGRVVDTAGDSVLAMFDSVIETVEAAVEIQRDLSERNDALLDHRRMHFRIGINLGDIIIRDDGTAYGDGVNVAARLEGLAEPGGIMVSGSAHEQVEGKLDVGLADAGEHEVKNIAKPVRAYRVLLDGAEAEASTKTSLTAKALSRPKVLAGLVGALAVIIGFAVWGVTVRVEVPQMVMADGTPTDDPVLAMPTGPVIAVLPFNNLGSDADQDVFADGIATEILKQLSRASGLKVISRGSSFRYRDPSLDAREVGRELGAAFLVLGTVQREGERLRIGAELFQSLDGEQLWSNSYDRDFATADIFAAQDEIANAIVATIADEHGVISQVVREQGRNRDVASLSSYECVLLGHTYFEVPTPENHARARDCLEQAVEKDPEYADAWGWLAVIYTQEHSHGFNSQPEALERALRVANVGVTADRNSQLAWQGKAAAHWFRHEMHEFAPAARKAVALNPNDASTLAIIGWYFATAGMYEEGLPLLNKALALSPYPVAWWKYPFLEKAYQEGDYETALAIAHETNFPGFFWSNVNFAMIYGQLGQADKAAAEIETLLSLAPDDIAQTIREKYRIWNAPEPLIRKIVEGLRKAGLDIPDEPVPTE